LADESRRGRSKGTPGSFPFQAILEKQTSPDLVLR
jgi:hypothetical protein